MSKTVTLNNLRRGEPTWSIAELFPEQGGWDEDEYLWFSGNRQIEFDNGFIEVLPMPTALHQTIVFFLMRTLYDFAEQHGLGKVLGAPFRVRLWKEKFREPDAMFMLARHKDRMLEKYWRGADLVMEVVSDSVEDRRRDLVTKRREYARAHIPEYWIVDPEKREIVVLRLVGKKYVVHGQFGKGEIASSVLLKGFEVAVDTVFSQR
jgi:Uma2 family endonuclease